MSFNKVIKVDALSGKHMGKTIFVPQGRVISIRELTRAESYTRGMFEVTFESIAEDDTGLRLINRIATGHATKEMLRPRFLG